MRSASGPVDEPGSLTAKQVHAILDCARLTQARNALGLTKRALADKLGISPAAVGQYESGTIKPRVEQLAALAEKLEVPVGFFAGGRPRIALDASMAHFRSLRATRRYEREQALTFVEQTWEVAFALSDFVRMPTLDLPGWDVKQNGDTPSNGIPCLGAVDPVAAARDLRVRWGLEEKPIAHVVRTLESKGIIVTVLDLEGSGRIDAFSTSRTPRPVLVLTRDKDDVYRHRFNAAHELGHLVMHTDALPGDIQHEREANAFAAEFLSPGNQLADQLPTRLDFGVLLRLQSKWGVSVESLLYRSQELGVLSEASHRRGRIRLNQLRSTGNLSHCPIGDFPGEQAILLRRAYDLAQQNGLSMKELADRLALQPSKVREIVGAPDSRPALTLLHGELDRSASGRGDERRAGS